MMKMHRTVYPPHWPGRKTGARESGIGWNCRGANPGRLKLGELSKAISFLPFPRRMLLHGQGRTSRLRLMKAEVATRGSLA
jgi:hypothetical protein